MDEPAIQDPVAPAEGHVSPPSPGPVGAEGPHSPGPSSRWGRKRIAISLGVLPVVAAAIAIPLTVMSSGSPSYRTVSSEGYSFINPANGAKGADPLFVNAQPGDWPACAQAYQVLTDLDIAAGGAVPVNMGQVNNDVGVFNTTVNMGTDTSLTFLYLKVPWELYGARSFFNEGQYRAAYNTLFEGFSKGCTGSPYTWG